MNPDVLQQISEYTKSRHQRKRRQRVVTGLAAVVVFCTTYALILPAITMEKQCEIPVHTHTDSCYTLETTFVEKQVPVCTVENLNLHRHTDACYDSNREPVCGYADFVIHQHDSDCYDENGALWCPLPVVKAHTHTDSCWATAAVHEHTDACYTWEEGELVCGQEAQEGHSHSEEAGCYASDVTCTCQIPESECHRHNKSCYDENGDLICGQTEGEGAHTHGEGCYEVTSVLTCETPETAGHQHTSDCYQKVRGELICTQSTQAEDVDPELTCEKPEIIPHAHTSICHDENGSLICGKTQILEHRHTAACFQSEEVPVESKVLICELTEHTHSESCLLVPADQDVQTDDSDGLAVQGSVDSALEDGELLTDTPEDETELPDEKKPLDVAPYVTKNSKFFYRTDDQGEWLPVENAEVPGNASLRLQVDYANVNIDDLIAAGYQMTMTLPDIMRNPVANGSITSGNTEAGTITASENKITLLFSEKWLNDQKKYHTMIDGDFYVESAIDLSVVSMFQPGKVTIGNIQIEINFEGNLIAKAGEIDIEKPTPVFSEEASGDYLTYTIRVTAGQDGAPQVKVVDTFTRNQEYIDSYVGVTNTASSTSTNQNVAIGPVETGGTGTVQLDESGSMVWAIGDMQAGETRELRYKVKLKPGFSGGKPAGTITNEATPYSMTYSRDPAVSNFIPKAAATLSKQSTTFAPDQNGGGGGTITYTIWVKAADDNSYTLDDVVIWDALDGSLDNASIATPEKYRKYLSYEEDSFHLYQGGVKDQNGAAGLTEITDAAGAKIAENGLSFTYSVGAMKPGETKTLIYTLKVAPGVFPAAGNDNVQITNRAVIATNGEKLTEGDIWERYRNDRTIGKKVWNRKLVDTAPTEGETIAMSGEAYDATGETIFNMENPGSFDAPAGSYRYQVVANEAGDWDVSKASMTDTLNGSYMCFTGYVRVDAYSILDQAPTTSMTNNEVIANLSARVPAKTVWVKVDGKTSFTFRPTEIDLDGPYAYILTYYAKPVNLDAITKVTTDNRFTMTGEVGWNGQTYPLTSVQVQTSVTIEGGKNFGAKKLSWYYEPPKVTSGDFVKGALYWVIQVDGNEIPAGVRLKDVTDSTHYIRGTSLVGVYTGKMGEQSLADFENLAALQTSGILTAVPSGTVQPTLTNNDMTLAFNNAVALAQGESLYVIVKTEPASLPGGVRDSKTYSNSLQSSMDESGWIDRGTVSQTLYGNNGVLKEYGKTITYDGNEVKEIDATARDQSIAANSLGKPGTFVLWQIQANHFGTLSGRYRFVETIPEGMEIAYLRYYWTGPDYSQKPTPVRLTAEELSALGGAWTEHSQTIAGHKTNEQTTVYYYTNGQTVIWDVDGLVAGYQKDRHGMEFQIACRVTDPDVLLGNAAKDFPNRVKLLNADGKEISSSSSTVSLQKQTIQKSGNYDPAVGGGRYPFTISVNPLGEDLVMGSDKLTLVDELSSTLSLDTATLKVRNTKTNEEITNYKLAVHEQRFTLELPDNVPLTITYETTVTARPGQAVDLFNRAHWEGYSVPSSAEVEVRSFSYKVGGTVGANTPPSIQITKLDSNNASIALPGAKFSLQDGTYQNGVFTPGQIYWTATSDDNGVLTFGKEPGQVMKYNTIYCLTEVEQPDGYVLDATPHYFAIAQEVENEDGSKDYPKFPEGVTVWYQSPEYPHPVYNRRGEIHVAKNFRDAGGFTCTPIAGTYTFGLYETNNASGDPLQTVSITYTMADKEADKTATFRDLDLKKTYYVFELDDQGNPIRNNESALIHKRQFMVIYPDGSVGVTNGDTFRVTNQSFSPELPSTGGIGTHLFTAGGLMLTISAACILLYQFIKRRKEENASS